MNGESIQEFDVELARRTAPPGTVRKQIVQGLIEEALLAQEGRRLKLDAGEDYRRAKKSLRQSQASSLIGIAELRRYLERKGRKPGTFAAFFTRAQPVWDALPVREKEQVDTAIRERFSRLAVSARVSIDKKALGKFAILPQVPPEQALRVIAARAPWGSITLADILSIQPFEGHQGQNPAAVLEMWQKLAEQYGARELIAATAESEGLFAPEPVRRESRKAEREALRNLVIEQFQRNRLTAEMLDGWIERRATALTREHGLSIEVVTLAAGARIAAEAEFSAFKDGKAGQATRRELLPLDQAWGRLTREQRVVLMPQAWGTFTPLIRTDGGYNAMRPAAEKAPEGRTSLKDLAEAALRQEIYTSLTEDLVRRANITVD